VSLRDEKIKHLLTRNVEKVIDRVHLEAMLESGKMLRIKFGIDPTSPELHLGHAVVLRKLREFQDLGHKAVLIIGDFTGRIGDPSGRDTERKLLSLREIRANMREYLSQAGKVIDVKKAEIVYNSAWFKRKNPLEKIFELARAGSIQQMLHREDFKTRIKAGRDVTLLEVFYPLLQGYDSVMVRADVELGGADQLFNLLAGRKVQRHFGVKEQDIMTVPLLEGLDGVRKMSKTFGNYIGLDEEPDSMFGKIMSLPDSLLRRYFLLSTGLEEKEIDELESKLSPRDLKARLGFEIVKLYHGEKKAKEAERKFTALFSKREIPRDLPLFEIDASREREAIDVVLRSGVVKSRSAARRMIEGGGFRINDKKITDPDERVHIHSGDILKIGKRHFFRAK